MENETFEAESVERPIMHRVNLGTFPVPLAKNFAKMMRDAKKDGKFAPENVVLRGRGSRKKHGDKSGISLKYAEKAAMYVDIDITDAVKWSPIATKLEETSKMLEEAHDKIDQLNDALEVEANKRLMPGLLRKSFEEYIIYRMMVDTPDKVYDLMKSGFVGTENQSELEILVKLDTFLRSDTCDLKNKLV